MVDVPDPDPSLDTLLALDGQVLVLVAAFWSDVESMMRERGIWS